MRKSAANGKVPNGVEKQKRQVSFAEAAANISCTDLADFLGKDPRRSGLRNFLDFYSKAFSGVTCPWYDMFKPSALTNLFDVIHVPLSQIPDAVYQKSVDWLDQHVPEHMLPDFVFSSFRYILNELSDPPDGDGDGDGDETKDDNAIFVAIAMLLRRTPHIYTARLPDVTGDKKLLVPLKIWILSQAPQDDLPACLFSWAHNLVPLLQTDPMARHLILCFIEKILEKPDAPTILTDAPAWRGKRLIPPPSFEMLLRFTFPSARLEATARFEAIYPVLKKVTLARAPDFHIEEIFTLCLRLAGEGISNESAKEATDMAISFLTDKADDACWKHWHGLLAKMPKASAALVVNLVEKWHHLSPSSRKATEQSIQKLFISCLGAAGVAYSYPILAKEALCSLIEIVGCCKRCRLDHLYKIENLDPKFLVYFRANNWKKYFQKSSSYIREGTPESEELKQDTQQIFTASLKLAKQVKEAATFALWPLLDNVDCWKLWDDLYTENLEASAALLKTLVDEWEFFSTQLSGDTPRALRKTLKSFMLKNKKARGANARLYRKADKSCQVIWRRLFPASSSCLNGSAITAVVLSAIGALAYSNLGATTWWTRCSCT